jgi:hypothetical protein
VAFTDVSDESKAFVGSISIVHVVLSAGLLICNAMGVALCCVLRKYAKLCIKFGARAFTFSAVLVARPVKIYVRIVR